MRFVPRRDPAHRPVSAERVFGYLRLIAAPVLLAGQAYHLPERPEATGIAFVLAFAAFVAYAVGTVIFVPETPSTRLGALLTAADLFFAGALTYTSGGGFSELRYVFVFVAVATIFRQRTVLTGAASAAGVLLYVVQALAHSTRRSRSDEFYPFVGVQALSFAWLGAAATLLSFLLARREAAIERLTAARQLLVAESLAAEERERRRIAEDLHDGPVQTLLAARFDLEEAGAGTAAADGPLARAYLAVGETVGDLRTAMSDLHPYLLDQVGLETALRSVANRAAERGGFEVSLRVSGRQVAGPNDGVLLRSATELLTNAVKHASARHVGIRVDRSELADVLEVVDDGVGFEPAVLADRIPEGHIGLLSLGERAAGLGGTLTIETRAGGTGSRFLLQLPGAPDDAVPATRAANGRRP
jgi:two-component system NarL family sensor kinase